MAERRPGDEEIGAAWYTLRVDDSQFHEALRRAEDAAQRSKEATSRGVESSVASSASSAATGAATGAATTAMGRMGSAARSAGAAIRGVLSVTRLINPVTVVAATGISALVSHLTRLGGASRESRLEIEETRKKIEELEKVAGNDGLFTYRARLDIDADSLEQSIAAMRDRFAQKAEELGLLQTGFNLEDQPQVGAMVRRAEERIRREHEIATTLATERREREAVEALTQQRNEMEYRRSLIDAASEEARIRVEAGREVERLTRIIAEGTDMESSMASEALEALDALTESRIAASIREREESEAARRKELEHQRALIEAANDEARIRIESARDVARIKEEAAGAENENTRRSIEAVEAISRARIEAVRREGEERARSDMESEQRRRAMESQRLMIDQLDSLQRVASSAHAIEDTLRLINTLLSSASRIR